MIFTVVGEFDFHGVKTGRIGDGISKKTRLPLRSGRTGKSARTTQPAASESVQHGLIGRPESLKKKDNTSSTATSPSR
jgi:hypothetical protein